MKILFVQDNISNYGRKVKRVRVQYTVHCTVHTLQIVQSLKDSALAAYSMFVVRVIYHAGGCTNP